MSEEPKSNEPVQEEASATPAAPAYRTPLTVLMDVLVGLMRFLRAPARGFAAYKTVVTYIGLYVLLGVCALYFIEYIVMAIKGNSFRLCLTGVAGTICLLVVHYAATKFTGTCGRQLLAKAGTTPSYLILDCLAVVAVLAAVASLAQGIRLTIDFRSALPLLMPTICCILLLHVALFCANPKEGLHIESEVGEGDVAQSALSLLSLPPRIALALVPFVVCYGIVGLSIWLVVAMVRSWCVTDDLTEFGPAARTLGRIALFPVVAWLGYLGVGLALNLFAAVLRIARNTEPKA